MGSSECQWDERQELEDLGARFSFRFLKPLGEAATMMQNQAAKVVKI
jgi:hypothetical protein